MTSRRPKPAALRRRGPLILATAGLLPALTACAGAAAQVHLPAKPTVQPAAVSQPTALTPRQQVIAALAGYTAGLDRADKSKSKSAARQLLGQYLVPGRIGGLVQAMGAIWARGESFYGHDIVHVSSVTVAGRHAFVHDCDDTSGMGLVNTATGQIVPGSAGVPRVDLVTRLELVHDRWLVEFQLVEDVPCAP